MRSAGVEMCMQPPQAKIRKKDVVVGDFPTIWRSFFD
jgi:hypothetical protein